VLMIESATRVVERIGAIALNQRGERRRERANGKKRVCGAAPPPAAWSRVLEVACSLTN